MAKRVMNVSNSQQLVDATGTSTTKAVDKMNTEGLVRCCSLVAYSRSCSNKREWSTGVIEKTVDPQGRLSVSEEADHYERHTL